MLTSIYLKLIFFFKTEKSSHTKKENGKHLISLTWEKEKKCKRAISSQDSCPGSSRCVKVCLAFSLHPEIPPKRIALALPAEGAQRDGDRRSIGT